MRTTRATQTLDAAPSLSRFAGCFYFVLDAAHEVFSSGFQDVRPVTHHHLDLFVLIPGDGVGELLGHFCQGFGRCAMGFLNVLSDEAVRIEAVDVVQRVGDRAPLLVRLCCLVERGRRLYRAGVR